MRLYHSGDRGEPVRDIQRRLTGLGFPVTADGTTDPEALAALADAETAAVVIQNPNYLGLVEPVQALVAGEDGLDDIRSIIDAAPDFLRPGGWLWLEHGRDQGSRVVELLQGRGFQRVALRRDLAGQERHAVEAEAGRSDPRRAARGAVGCSVRDARADVEAGASSSREILNAIPAFNRTLQWHMRI